MKNLLINSKNLKIFPLAAVAKIAVENSFVDAKAIYTKTVCKNSEIKEGFTKTAVTTVNKTLIQTSFTIFWTEASVFEASRKSLLRKYFKDVEESSSDN